MWQRGFVAPLAVLLAAPAARAQVSGPPSAGEPAPAAARAPRRAFTLSLSGGYTGAFSDRNWAQSQGYRGGHVQLGVERARLLGPLGLRADAFAHGVTRRALGGSDLSTRTVVPGVSAALVAPLGRERRAVRPYALAGPGWYNTEYGSRREWHFGLQGGVGARFDVGRGEAFAEARLHRVADGSTPRLVPLSLGFRF